MFTHWKKAWPLARDAANSWIDDYAPSMGAALSYYTMFSLAPMILLVISIAGLVFGEDAARGALFGQIQGLVGTEASLAIQELLAGVSKPGKGITGTVIGVVVLLIGATTVFGELQDAMDRIWRAPARNKSSGIFSLLRSRFLSFGMIMGIAFLLMVSLVLSAAIAALGTWWGAFFPGWELVAQLVNVVVGFGMTTVVFAMIFKVMPRVKVEWRDVWLGAAVTSFLFTLGRFLIGLYIGKSDIATGFGAAGSLIIVFVWVYYSAQIFLMGAEFTWVYAKAYGSMRGLQTADAATPADADSVKPAKPSHSGAAPTPAPEVPRRSQDAPTTQAPQISWGRLAATALAFVALHTLSRRAQRKMPGVAHRR